MKMISLTQPWATLMAISEKVIETRSWRTSYRGPLAIHAAKGWSKFERSLLDRDPFGPVLARAWPGKTRADIERLVDDARGHVVCVVDLVDIRKIDETIFRRLPHGVVAREHEAAFGNYTPGRWAWCTRLIGTCKVEAAGHQGCRDVPVNLRNEIQKALRA